MSAALKHPSSIVNAIKDNLLLLNHGFSQATAMKKLTVPKIPVPKTYSPDKLVIKDPYSLKSRLRKVKREGLEQFKIVADFDQTLTKSIHDGRKVESSLGIVRNSELMSEESKDNIEAGFREYKKATKVLSLNKSTKAAELNKCMTNTFQNILSENLTLESIEDMMKDAFIVPRPRLDSYLNLCSEFKIPFYVISAGISNVVASVINNYIDLETYQNFFIYSNEMIFNEEGKLVNFSKPYVHSYAKDDIFQKTQAYRKNHLILGDLLHDVMITKNISPRLSTSIGFLNYVPGYNIENILYDYSRKYDIVVLSDESIVLPEMITKFILDLESEKNLFQYIDDHSISISEGKAHLYHVKERVDQMV